MALLSGRSVHLARSCAAAAAGRGLVPCVQRTVCRHFTSSVQVAEESQILGAAVSDPDEVATQTAPIFVSWSVYKSKGALSVKPVKPRWTTTSGGAFQLDRPGGIMFELAAAKGERSYNWDNKVMVQLRAEEIGNLLASPEISHQFYHDTYKGQPGREGTLVKTFKWSLAPDGGAYFINASVQDKAANTSSSASVSISPGEFFVLKQLLSFSIPHILGWDAAFGP